MSKIKVNSIEAATGSTITIPSGQTLDISSTTLTLPSTVVTTTGTQTLTNKTIGVSQLTGTLPVANGGTGLTTLGSASQVLRVNSGATALEFATAPSGKVLQVVQSIKQDTISSNSNSWVTTGLSTSITPSNSSNKVLILINVGAVGGSNTTAFRIYKGGSHLTGASGTPVSNREGVSFRTLTDFADLNHAQSGSFTYLDSPSTTSSTTYTLYFRNQAAGSATSSINYALTNTDTDDSYGSRTASTIILMEIQA
jgi:hypothetical protein